MARQHNIGTAAQLSGLSVKAIRFYEAEGYIPLAPRTEGGYRTFSDQDVRRLRLARQMRMLGLAPAQIGSLLDRAFGAECGEFGDELLTVFAAQRHEIKEHIAALEALSAGLDRLEAHVSHCECTPGLTAADCDCLLLDEEGGDCDER